jgi:predicted TPR repeat methyltransferase
VSKRAPQKPQVGHSLPALLAEGIEHHQSGDLDAALRCYQRALAKQPGNPDALHLSGLVARQRGDLELALSLIRTAIARAPLTAMFHVNLGRVLAETGRPAESVEALERALELQPDLVAAAYNLGVAYEELGRLADAEEHYRWAADEGGSAPASFNLGNLLVARGQVSEGIAAYLRALSLDPEYLRAHANLGFAQVKAGDLDAARATYERLLALDPTDVEAEHMVAALAGVALDRADPGYVARFFDDYASRFEKVLVDELAYDTPRVLAELATRHAPPSGRFACALDLGCGTGLSGRAVRSIVDGLEGVDLSSKMIDVARAAGGYDELVVADLLTHMDTLAARARRYDLVLAADVLNYLGVLDGALERVARLLGAGGRFVFSIEKRAEGTQAKAFALDATGRFSHDPEYVRGLAARLGLAILEELEHPLRLERGAPVVGVLFCLGLGVSTPPSLAHP